ncbi:MAG: molybdopterin-guanine dinucleotide biosynthesis protein B [Spirochaetes bacterium]|nr:molybdopterin-guanine dinucleotide biosynthesis protein B [Spirochaetota bacterium]
MKVVQIVGYKNSGKTTLILKILQLLGEKGLKCAVIKSSHSLIKHSQTDSGLFFQQGADPVLLHTPNALMIQTQKKDLLCLFRQYHEQVDFMLLEGFKSVKLPRIVCLSDEDDNELLENAFCTVKKKKTDYVFQKQSSPIGDFNTLVQHLCQMPEFPAAINCKKCGYSCFEYYTTQPDTECIVKESSRFQLKINNVTIPLMPFIEIWLMILLLVFWPP